MPRSPLKYSLGILLFSALYFCGGQLGLQFQKFNSVTHIWPPSGIALAAVLLFGRRIWPGIVIGVMLLAYSAGVPVKAYMLGILGNVIEPIFGAWLITRFTGGRKFFATTSSLLRFVGLATLFSPLIAATLGTTGFCVAGIYLWENFSLVWVTWWLGNAMSILLLTPAILVWYEKPVFRQSWTTWAEICILYSLLAAISWTVFGMQELILENSLPLTYLPLPFIIWIAIRFGVKGVTVANLFLAVVAIHSGAKASGPLNQTHSLETLILEVAFMGIMSITGLIVATVLSERKKAEMALRHREELTRAIVDSAAEGIMTINAHGKIRSFNPAAEGIFGYAASEVINKNVSMLMPENIGLTHDSYLNNFQQTGRSGIIGISREVQGKRRDGSVFPMLLSVGEVATTGPRCFSGIIQDITERKQVEMQLQASLEEKNTLLNEVHHRVKNNMQVISSLLSLQARRHKTPEVQTMLRASQNRIRSMALIHEKLYLSSDLARIDFNEYVQDLAANLCRVHDLPADKIDVQIKVDDIRLSLDTAVPCGLIINELVINALKHAFPGNNGGKIHIGLSRAEPMPNNTELNTLVLEVGDDGIGLPTSFDVKKTASLGLRLVYTLADQLKGTIQLHRGNGTVYKIRFSQNDKQNLEVA